MKKAQKFGSAGGQATVKKHGKEWMQYLAMKRWHPKEVIKATPESLKGLARDAVSKIVVINKITKKPWNALKKKSK